MSEETRLAIRDITATRCRLMAQQQTNLAAAIPLTSVSSLGLRKHLLESAALMLDAAKELSNG